MPDVATGILKRTKGGAGTLYNPERPSSGVLVPPGLVREHKLPEGATVAGPVRDGKLGPELAAVETVCGLTPEAFRKRTPFNELVAVNPCDRFDLAVTGEMAMRLIDLVAPIGKGTRGLIVSPPKAGKTVLLEQIGRAIRTGSPKTKLIILLIDERPEEVTHFRRSLDAAVFASSSDQPLREHVELAELMLAHIRTELECGYDIVVLLDSLTRLSRTFNLRGAGSGRTMSGGLDAGALEIPRRFFGIARNVENGGSVTILATILIDTGSRLDQLIFEEFKGTGNSEIVLDRALAEARIFPAINLLASSTRKEELLYSPDDSRRIAKLRRLLADRKPQDALESLIQLLDKYPTNQEFLQSVHLAE
jgi:transcription termination factor Rho